MPGPNADQEVRMDMTTEFYSSRDCLRGGVLGLAFSALRYLVSGCTALGVIACVLLATSFVVMPRTAHASNGQCIWEGGLGAPTYPSCVNEDCLGQGGLVDCTDPVIRPPGQ